VQFSARPSDVIIQLFRAHLDASTDRHPALQRVQANHFVVQRFKEAAALGFADFHGANINLKVSGAERTKYALH